MNLKIEKLECPNCHAKTVEVNYDDYTARCPHCDSTFFLWLEGGEKILIEREERKTMESENNEFRKNVSFLNEEDRVSSEFERTEKYRDASDKLKWAVRGAGIGAVIGVIAFILGRNIIIPLAVILASTLLFTPQLFNGKTALNIGIKIISALAVIGLVLYAGLAHNTRVEKQKEETQILANEKAAAKIPLGVSSQQVLGINYHEAIRLFQENGFINVQSEAVDDLTIETVGDQDTVIAVSIKGTTAFDEKDIYPENVLINVIYHNLGEKAARIEVGTSSEDMKDQQYTVVQGIMKDAGFINVELEPIYDLTLGILTKEGAVETVSIGGNSEFYASSEFRYDETVRIAYHAKKSDEKNDHTGEVKVPSSAKKYVGRNYEDVEKELKSAGFVNIETVRKYDRQKKEKDGDIVLISINGKTDFDKDTWFVAESNVIITYYGPKTAEEKAAEHPDEVEMIDSAKKLKGTDYEETVAALSAAGFTNITAEPVYDLKTGIINKEGEIKTITAGGKDNFAKGDWFSPDVEIKITYHAFKEKTESKTTDKEKTESKETDKNNEEKKK